MYFYWIIAGILLLYSAFFSLSETAITGTSNSFLVRKKQQGVKKTNFLSKLLKNTDNTITCLLIGNNLSNILLTIVLTFLTIHTLGEDYIFIMSIGITIVILVFAEILPKTYAYSNANNIALFMSPFILLWVFLLKPIAFIFLKVNQILLYFFFLNKKPKNTSIFASVDNLRGAIELLDREEETSNNNVLQEKAMLHGILDLTEITAENILTHRKNVIAIDINDSKEKQIAQILHSPYTRVVVYRDDLEHILGVLNVKEFFVNYVNKKNDITITELIKEAYFLPETTYVIDMLHSFKEKQERIALIVDEYGAFMGIITLGDILEEITGKLVSSQQKSEFNIIKNKNYFIVPGDLKIRDLNREMNLSLPDEEVTTVAGLILYKTAKIPNKGNIFIFDEYRFEILEKRNHRLTRIKISKEIK